MLPRGGESSPKHAGSHGARMVLTAGVAVRSHRDAPCETESEEFMVHALLVHCAETLWYTMTQPENALETIICRAFFPLRLRRNVVLHAKVAARTRVQPRVLLTAPIFPRGATPCDLAAVRLSVFFSAAGVETRELHVLESAYLRRLPRTPRLNQVGWESSVAHEFFTRTSLRRWIRWSRNRVGVL